MNRRMVMRRKIERSFSWLFRGVLLAVIFGVHPVTVLGQETVIVKIGHVAPMTGPIGHLGIDNERGAKLAIEDLNEKRLKIGGKIAKFELLSRDDKATPAVGIAVANELVALGVHGVIGHLNSGTSIPASAIYQAAGIPQISPSATNPKFTLQGFKTVFRVVMDDRRLAEYLGVFAARRFPGLKIGILDDRTAYGAQMADNFQVAALAEGADVVSREFTRTDAVDWSATLRLFMDQGVQVVFYGGMDTAAGRILRQMRALGLDARMFGGDGICSEELVRIAGGALASEQVICAEAGGVTDEQKPAYDAFNSRMQIRFGQPVQIYSPYVYDSVTVMANAMVRAGSIDPSKYLPFLASGTHEGLMGPIGFDEHGDVRFPSITLYSYINGKRQQLGVFR
jgi:branched-chain amino acid transport system substrate-binding protein